MITSYEVGAIFKIADAATPTILKISEGLEKLSLKLKLVEDRFAAFSKMTFGGINTSLTATEKHLTAVSEKSEIASKALSDGMARADSALGRTGAQIGKLRSELDHLRGDMASLGRLPGPGGGGGGNPGGGGRHPNRPRNGGGHGGGGHVGLGLGIAGVVGAEEIGHGLYDVVKQASELKHVQEQMIQGGFQASEVAKSLAESWRVANKYGIDVAKVMGDIKELRTPFGSTDEAINFIEPLERMRVVLDAVSEGSGTNSRDAIYKMARAGELKGLTDAKDYLTYFDAMTKVISATGGKVGPNDFMQATKYARLSALGLDQEYYTKYLPTMIQALGASGAGTANAALFGTLIQGKASGRSVEAMKDLGLIGDMSKVYYKKGTKDIAGFHSGAVIDSELLTRNPLEWVRKDLLPLMEKKFGDLGDEKNRSKAIDNLGDFFGNRMSAQAVGEMLFRMKSFDRDAKLLGNAKGLGSVEDLQKNDPDVAAHKLVGAWENLMKALGGPLVDPAVKAMNGLSAGLSKLTEWATAHPEAVKQIGAARAGLAAGLGVLAAAGLVAAATALAPGGAIALAVATIGGAIAGLAALNWSAVAAGLKSLWDSIEGFFSRIPKFKGQSYDSGSDLPGVQNESYSGAGVGGLLRNISFSNDNGGAAGVSGLPGIVNTSGGVINIYVGGGTAATGGGGIVRASYGGGRGGGGRLDTSLAGANPEVAAYIRKTALSYGIDPDVAIAVANSEALRAFDPNRPDQGGDGGTSFGPFQLHYGGGLGDTFTRMTGLNARDPRTWKAQVAFALAMAKKGGWGPWHGAANTGIGTWQGLRGYDPASTANGASVPGHILGMLSIGGESFRFGSGGVRGASSIPFGDYPITPGTVGAWGVAHNAVGINDNKIWDSALGRMRLGIMMHAGHTANLITEGCLAFEQGQWPHIKARVLAMVREHGHAYLHVGKDGASVTPDAKAAFAGPPPKKHETVIHAPIHLDGKQIAQNTTRHQAYAGMFPTAVGGIDAHGSFASPGTPLFDAA